MSDLELPRAAMIRLDSVAKKFPGRTALGAVSLTVAPGEAVAILGPSGSGKSTLLNLVAGLDRPDHGTVHVNGVQVSALSERRSARLRRTQIGMVFQFFNLLDDLTVEENILLPARLAGLSRVRARARASDLLAELGIQHHRTTHPNRLSGGERQRVALARALVNDPPVLLADEPTGALDSAAASTVAELLRAFTGSGRTMLLVTHSARLAEACASRVVELVDGEVAHDRTTLRGPDGSSAAGVGAAWADAAVDR